MRSPTAGALKVEGTARINQVSRQHSPSLCHTRSVSPLRDGGAGVRFPTKDTLIVPQRFFAAVTYDPSGWGCANAYWLMSVKAFLCRVFTASLSLAKH